MKDIKQITLGESRREMEMLKMVDRKKNLKTENKTKDTCENTPPLTHMLTHNHIYTYTLTNTDTLIHIHSHTQTHTHTHTNTHSQYTLTHIKPF